MATPGMHGTKTGALPEKPIALAQSKRNTDKPRGSAQDQAEIKSRVFVCVCREGEFM